MSSPSILLFLLFLLIVPFSVAGGILLFRQEVRERISRAAHRITRVQNVVLNSYLGTLFRAPAGRERLQRSFVIMESSIVRRDAMDRWRTLLSESDATIEDFLPQMINGDFAEFIRCIILRVFLVVFQNVDAKLLTLDNLRRVSAALHQFFNDAQGRSDLPPEIQEIVTRWLPADRFLDPFKTIFPTYEALWRIVAAIVVRCEDDKTEPLCWLMLDFRDNPRDRQYKVAYGSNGRSVSAFTDDVVDRLAPIARIRYTTNVWWPFNFLHHPPAPLVTEGSEEALKFAALVASKVIGRLRPRYALSTWEGSGSQDQPWDKRKMLMQGK